MSAVTPMVELLVYTDSPAKTIAIAAKLCYSSYTISELDEKMDETNVRGFIEKLRELGHLSPFEHASFTFGIEGISRSLLAQITRHRIASFSVKSQRYVTTGGSETFNYIIPESIIALGEDATTSFTKQMDTMQEWYNGWQQLLGGASEKSNEDARFVLPNAAETKMIVTMNARELMHFFELRCCNRAQWEIRNVAWQMLKLVNEVAPAIFKISGPTCIAGACSEGKMSCKLMKEVKIKREELNK